MSPYGATVVVLDVDDTVYLERDYVASGFKAVDAYLAERHGTDGFFDFCWHRFVAGTRRTTFDDAIRHFQLSVPVDELVSLYRSHYPEISLSDDAVAFLDCLNGPLGIVTDGPPESQRAKLAALGLNQRCDHVVVTAEHGSEWSKPGLAAFRHLERKFAASSSELVYIADNPRKDFIAPAKLGWHTVRIRRHHSLYQDLATPPGTCEIESLTDLSG